MAARKPTSRERHIALSVGLVLRPGAYGHWLAIGPSGEAVYVIDGTAHTWADFRQFAADVQQPDEDGKHFRFE